MTLWWMTKALLIFVILLFTIYELGRCIFKDHREARERQERRKAEDNYNDPMDH
jgi:hypothetical protein